MIYVVVVVNPIRFMLHQILRWLGRKLKFRLEIQDANSNDIRNANDERLCETCWMGVRGSVINHIQNVSSQHKC